MCMKNLNKTTFLSILHSFTFYWFKHTKTCHNTSDNPRGLKTPRGEKT